jgi:hypothetical protein
MNIDPITLPEFPLSGLAMAPHMAAIQAWGMACAKVGALEAFRYLRDQPSGKTNEGSGG